MGGVSVWEGEKVLDLDGSDDTTGHILPLNCAFY